MFESRERLGAQIADVLEGIRAEAGGWYACLLDARTVFFEAESPEASGAAVRERLQERAAALFALPAAMAGDGPAEDIFEGWNEGFLLAFVNGRVALVVACPDPEAARARLDPLLRLLVDRLLRFDESWRIDAHGRGLFLGRPRLDLVVIGPSD